MPKKMDDTEDDIILEPCSICGGDGVISEPEEVCCGNFLENGMCCGMMVMVMNHEICWNCFGKGVVTH